MISASEIKYWIIGTAIGGIALGLGATTVYRNYLSQGTKIALSEIDQKAMNDKFMLCHVRHSTNNYSPAIPKEDCIQFFTESVPRVFDFDGANQSFPLNSVREEDFVELYQDLQKDLEAAEMDRLPPLEEQTHGNINLNN